MQLKVKATKVCFIDQMRKYPGEVFFITEAHLKKGKDGSPLKDESGAFVLPTCMELAEERLVDVGKQTRSKKLVTLSEDANVI